MVALDLQGIGSGETLAWGSKRPHPTANTTKIDHAKPAWGASDV
jgi:hypothetical protein